MTSTKGLVTVRQPLGANWVVQSQTTGQSSAFIYGPSPVPVLSKVVGSNQKGVHLIQSHAPLVQPTTVIPQRCEQTSNQDTDEPSFSKTLSKKGKNIPKKIHIDKEEGSIMDPIVNVPQIQVVPPTPLETIVEKTGKKEIIIADSIIEQATVTSESTENTIDRSVSLTEEYNEVFEAEAIEPTADTEPANSEEPKEDPKLELLEEDKPVTDASLITNVDEHIASSETEPADENNSEKEDEKMSHDEVVQANDDLADSTGTEPQVLESNTIEENIEDQTNVDVQDDSLSDQEVVNQKGTDQEEPSPLEADSTTSENDLMENEISQDLETTEDLTKEQNTEIVEDLQQCADTQDLETAEESTVEVKDNITSEIAEENPAPIVDDIEESSANQSLETVEDTLEAADMPSQIVGEKADIDQPENNEQQETESTDLPPEEKVLSDIESDDQDTDTVATHEELSHQEDQPMVSSEGEDTSAQENVSSSVQEVNEEEEITSKQSPPVKELDNKEDETSEDIIKENQDMDESIVENSNDTTVETEEEQPVQDPEMRESKNNENDCTQENVEAAEQTAEPVDEKELTEKHSLGNTEQNEDLATTLEENNTPVSSVPLAEDKEEKDQPLVEGATDEVGPASEETDERNLVDNGATLEVGTPTEQEGSTSEKEDIDVNTGSMSAQEQGTTLEDNEKDKEAPVEDRDSNLEENVPNISENEVAAIQENLSNDQNIQDEKRAEATIQEKE